MDEISPTLLLTRPQQQPDTFLSDVNQHLGRSVPALISPLVRIESVGQTPDLDEFATIILTSGNTVWQLGQALKNRNVVTVGDKTARLARAWGADANALGENVVSLLKQSEQIRPPALYCRGRHSRGDLARNLEELGVTVEEVVLYDQVAQPLSQAARKLLNSRAPIIAPVFSPRSAKLLSEEKITAPIKILAISAATKSAWRGPGDVVVADRPDALHMLQLVQAVI